MNSINQLENRKNFLQKQNKEIKTIFMRKLLSNHKLHLPIFNTTLVNIKFNDRFLLAFFVSMEFNM